MNKEKENVKNKEKIDETKKEKIENKENNENKENRENKENKEKKESNENNLKKDATEAINNTKEQLKDMKFKEEAQKGKGLIIELLLDPIGTIKNIVKDDKNQYYKTALLAIAIWVLTVFLKDMLNFAINEYKKFNLLQTIKLVVSPLLRVLVLAVIIHILNKNKKQPIIKSITAVALAKIPVIVSSLLGFLTYISSNVTYVTSPISSLLSVISTVLMFFVVKEMFEKEDNAKAFTTFVKVEAIYYVVAFAFSFLGISL